MRDRHAATLTALFLVPSLAFAAPGLAPSPSSAPPEWTFVGPSMYTRPTSSEVISGRATALWSPPGLTDTIYIGTAGGGVWKTTDAGASWSPIFDSAGPQGIGAVAGDPGNPLVLYVGTGEGNFNDDALQGDGLYKSRDGGASWTHMPLPDMWGPYRGPIRKIAVDPRDPRRLYAAASIGLYYSLDGGATWNLTRMGSSSYYTACTDIALDSVTPSAGLPSVVHVAVGLLWGDTSNGVYRSLGGGAGPWAKITEAPFGDGFPSDAQRIGLAAAPSDPRRLYALVQRGGSAGLFATDDGTASPVAWALRNESGSVCSDLCWYDLALSVDADDPSRVVLGGVDAWISSDGGATLARVSDHTATGAEYAHEGHHALLLQANTLYAATDGGLFAAALDWGAGKASWASRNAGLGTLQFLSLAQHPTDPQRILASARANGLACGVGNSWTQVYAGDPGEVLWDAAAPAFAFTEGPGAYTLRNADITADPGAWACIRSFGGATCDPSPSVDGGKVATYAPMAFDPNAPGALLTGGSRVYLNASARTGSDWSPLGEDLVPPERWDFITAVHAAPNGGSGGILYAGLASGRLHASFDGGAHWQEVTGPIGSQVTSMATHPQDGRRVLVTTWEYWGHQQVFRSLDGGISWLDITGPLPYGTCHTIVLDPADPGRAYVGTERGVWENPDVWGGNGWVSINANLPEAAVRRLAFGPGGRLRAATYGRGIWELPGSPTCTGALIPTGTTWDAEGGSSSVAVHVPVECSWVASSPSPWASVSPMAGTGPGMVSIAVAANPNPGARNTRVSIAGQVFEVSQAGRCSYGLSISSQSFPAAGGGGTVTIAAPQGCGWSADSSESWITVQGSLGQGAGEFSFAVAPNAAPESRTGMLTAGGRSFLVSQDGQCIFSADPTSATFGAESGIGSVAITVAEGCDWTATTDTPWLEVLSGTPGSGSGTVTYSVGPNDSPLNRTGTIYIGPLYFNVTQEGGCSYAVDPSYSSFGAEGGIGSFVVSAQDGCAWEAVTADTWIATDPPASGAGNGQVSFSVAPNPSIDYRTGTIRVAGLTHHISQAGNTCVLTCYATAPRCGLPDLGLPFNPNLYSSGCTGTPVYLWTFGDGATSAEASPTHAYATAGTYGWSLLVTYGGSTCSRTGSVEVVPRMPGDGDGNAAVTIGELQKAINMFLGLLAPGSGADCNGDGRVTIGELQKVINAYLGTTCGC